MNDFLVRYHSDQILRARQDIARTCDDCKEAFNGLCDRHLFYLSKIMPYLASNIPFHFVQEVYGDKSETEEKKVREFDPVSGKLSKPFDCYSDLMWAYIEGIDKKVLQNGYSFLFYGFNGSGKTHTSIHLLMKALDRGLTGYFIFFKDLINLYNKSEFKREEDASRLYSHVMNCDFLVVDELGKESSITDNLLGSFEQIVKHRCNILKPTVYTTNIDFPNEEGGFLERYKTSVYNSMLQHYRILQFSKAGNFRVKKRKEWEI